MSMSPEMRARRAPLSRRVQGAMPYVLFDVPVGTAPGIARFYAEVLGMPGALEQNEGAPCARVQASATVDLLFRETDKELAPFDGHHIQVSLVNFSGPHAKLLERGLITQESNEHQYRFVDIVDLDSNKPLFQLEHEVRSVKHPLYARSWYYTVRNPSVNNRNFVPGREALVAAMELE